MRELSQYWCSHCGLIWKHEVKLHRKLYPLKELDVETMRAMIMTVMREHKDAITEEQLQEELYRKVPSDWIKAWEK